MGGSISQEGKNKKGLAIGLYKVFKLYWKGGISF